MNIESIPKTLWHAISISILVVAIGFTYIAYKAEGFSLKYDGIELITQGNKALALNLKEQSELLSKREKELEELQALYEIKIKELEAANRQISSLTKSNTLGVTEKSKIAKVLRETEVKPESINLIKEKQENLKELSAQQQQLQQQQLQNLQHLQQIQLRY